MTTTTYNYTGGQQTFTVPDQVTSITATLVGGKGGNGELPGSQTATFTVTPGQILYLFAGGNGKLATSTVDATGGYNGGGKAFRQHSGNQAASGGGCTDIRLGGTALSNRILVAAGAGGRGGAGWGGSYSGAGGAGGKGGSTTGAAGGNGAVATTQSSSDYGARGNGGTQAAGGTAGVPYGTTGGATSTAGTSGVGGNGAWEAYDQYNPADGGQGGGGGGGYFGGGGGGNGFGGYYDGVHGAYSGGGGGGGGSNFAAATINGVAPTALSSLQGVTPAYSTGGYVVLTYNTKPLIVAGAPDLSHAASSSGSTNFFGTYSDDDTASPAFYQLIIEDNSTGVVAYDSTKTAVSGGMFNTTTKLLTVPVNLPTYLTANTQYRWKIRAWDAGGLVSDYTAYTVFPYKNPPIFTIVPANATVLGNGRPAVSWTGATFSMGASQESWRVRFIRTSDSAVLHDSGVTANTNTSYTPPTDVLPNAGTFTIEVTLTDTDGLAAVNTVSVTTSYTVPNPFNYTVDNSNVDEFGYVDIAWPTATSDPAWVSWRVYRRNIDDSDWTLIYETFDIGVHDYHDFLVQAGEIYQYAVTQSATVSGVIVESTPGYKSGGVLDGSSYYMDITQYWVIDTINPALSTLIPNVTSASMSEEYEEQTYSVIGRGRKKDYGTRLGYVGSLSAQLRGTDGTPKMIRNKIEQMRAAEDTYYLRTPQGDLFTIGFGDCEFAPLAGVGNSVMYDATIPFSEVAGEIVDEQVNVTVVVKYVLENATATDNGDETTTVIIS